MGGEMSTGDSNEADADGQPPNGARLEDNGNVESNKLTSSSNPVQEPEDGQDLVEGFPKKISQLPNGIELKSSPDKETIHNRVPREPEDVTEQRVTDADESSLVEHSMRNDEKQGSTTDVVIEEPKDAPSETSSETSQVTPLESSQGSNVPVEDPTTVAGEQVIEMTAEECWEENDASFLTSVEREDVVVSQRAFGTNSSRQRDNNQPEDDVDEVGLNAEENGRGVEEPTNPQATNAESWEMVTEPEEAVRPRQSRLRLTDPLSIELPQSSGVQRTSKEDRRRSQLKRTNNHGRLLVDIPKPGGESRRDRRCDYGLGAENGSFIRDDQPGPSNRPGPSYYDDPNEPGPSDRSGPNRWTRRSRSRSRRSQRGPRTPNGTPPSSPPRPPHAAYIDSDYRLALALQQEEDYKASIRNEGSSSYQSSSSDCYALSPRFFDEATYVDQDEDPDLVEQAHCLFKECRRKFPDGFYPEPFKIVGFSAHQLCQGYKEILRGNDFPYDQKIPPPPPGSPKQPESASIPLPYRIVENPRHQDYPERDEPTSFQKLVFSAEDRIKKIRKFDGPSTSAGSHTPINEYEDYNQPGPSNRRNTCQMFDYVDDSQPGPSNRRPVPLQQYYEDEDVELNRAIQLSLIEQENVKRREAGLPEKEIPPETFNGNFRVPNIVRKRKMNHALSEKDSEYSPPHHRQPGFYTVETVVEMDEPEISSTSMPDSKWPNCKWLDPEKMPDLETFTSEERRKMPSAYLLLISKEQKDRKERDKIPKPKKSQFEIDLDEEVEMERMLLEVKFKEIARNHIISPSVVPSEVANTKFEVYIRFPFIKRPLYVHQVLRALNIPDNCNSDEDIDEEMSDFVRSMTAGEFYKQSAYTWMGLKIDGSPLEKVLDESQLERARSLFFDSVERRLHQEAMEQQDEEERKCAESVAVSYLHSINRTDVSREDIKEMQRFQAKCMTDRQRRRRVPRNGKFFTPADLESGFRTPARIQREAKEEGKKVEAPIGDEEEINENSMPPIDVDDSSAVLENKIEAAESSTSQEPTQEALAETKDN